MCQQLYSKCNILVFCLTKALNIDDSNSIRRVRHSSFQNSKTVHIHVTVHLTQKVHCKRTLHSTKTSVSYLELGSTEHCTFFFTGPKEVFVCQNYPNTLRRLCIQKCKSQKHSHIRPVHSISCHKALGGVILGVYQNLSTAHCFRCLDCARNAVQNQCFYTCKVTSTANQPNSSRTGG